MCSEKMEKKQNITVTYKIGEREGPREGPKEDLRHAQPAKGTRN